MKALGKDELTAVSAALDELMILKSRPRLSSEDKAVWLKWLAGFPLAALLWAIERAIREKGWPEFSTLEDGCRIWSREHPADVRAMLGPHEELQFRSLLFTGRRLESAAVGVERAIEHRGEHAES